MLNDVTFGQYYPAKSFVHNMDPRAKIVLLIAYLVAVFLADNFFALAAVIVFLILAVIFSRVPFGSVLRSVKMILFIIVFTAILNLFFYASDGELHILWQWKIITVSWEAIINMIFLAMRLFLLVMGTSILTLTTTPVALTDGLESLLTPLKWIRFPVHELALIMSIALRFIPTLIDETNRIISAQKARGADFETGGLIRRAKAMIPVLVPLLVSSLRRAEELGDAMDARCYSGAKGRTKYKKLTFSWRDLLGLLVLAGLITGIVFLNLYLGGKFAILNYFFAS
ncbi:MAG TPA: energy-coupling factor transporter transmembrane protein EcfT [Candidatus Borkfalkia faecipullorum]|uniref:Energy-coupling factor transporter transmembrane protein EcfT n=1 Tax=Candidatus Borkfalkia faecipullorum TaxID=2838510 RepID=A0A9D1V9F7_9FIRM|nr:energy-coupling factor transporter transmembrane protein EcfT [Candidatus Borkfalkia faecipullorum]